MQWIYISTAVVLFLTVPGEGQTKIDLKTQAKSVDFSGASFTKPSKTGTVLPATCTVGETFFDTDAPAGQNLYGCTEVNVWTLLGGVGTLPAVTGQAGRVLSNDGTAAQWQGLGGDVSGAPNAVTVQAIRGRPISTAAPSDGQMLQWHSGSNQWQPGAAAGANPNFSASFIGQTVVAMAGSAHGLGTPNLLVSCYDDALPPRRVEPDEVTVNTTSYDVTVRFSAAQTGFCVVNGTGGTENKPVQSVFGRTGAVTAQTGDYTFAEISGMLDAGKVGGGGVSNVEFDALANVTGDVQAQLNGKATAVHSHVASGDVQGEVANLTVTRIQNRAVAPTAPADGQALVWNATGNAWQPGTVAGGGPGMAAQLGDLTVARASSAVLSIGAGCSLVTPCNVGFGNRVYSITTPATATISAGTGTAYVYVTSTGTVTVGHNLTLTCGAGCAAQAGVTAFPPDSVPLFKWVAMNGAWDATGGADQRAFLNTKDVAAGAGLSRSEAGGQTILSVDSATVPTYLSMEAMLDFGSIPSGACAAEKTFTVMGAAAGDAVAAGWPVALEVGLTGMMRVSAADTIAVRLCNFAGLAIDPANATFRATIVRSF